MSGPEVWQTKFAICLLLDGLEELSDTEQEAESDHETELEL